MKLKINHACYPLFYLVIMEFHISTEINKLNRFVNNKEILLFENFRPYYYFLEYNIKIKYLFYVLELTREHPEIEIYLKQLLENYRVAELNNYRFTHLPSKISLNSLEMIINFGFNVNVQDIDGNTSLHVLYGNSLCWGLDCESIKHTTNIIVLFVKYGANLNILNDNRRTVLDEILYKIRCLDEHNKKILIMTMIDFGAKTNNPRKNINMSALEFVESYQSSNIKPAIKK